MSAKKVLIRWDTKCAWNGKEQYVPRKTIDPSSPASLGAEVKIRVKFASRWYDAFVVLPWEKQRNGKVNFVCFTLFLSDYF